MISAVIHTKNSAKTLSAALQSVSWVDEIVIIDMHSSDETISIARNYTPHIYSVEDVGFADPMRNFGLDKASGDWILVLDSDEEAPASYKELLPKLTTQEVDAWQLPRKNLILGSWLKAGSWWPDYQIRFFKKGSVKWSEFAHTDPTVTGKLNHLPANEANAIIHHNYPSVEMFVDRLNRYTSITASQQNRQVEPPFEAFWHDFIRRYFAHQGYTDGTPGLNASLLQSFYEAVLSMKDWEMKGRPESRISVDKMILSIKRELAYWYADYRYKHAANPVGRIYWQVRRKLKR